MKEDHTLLLVLGGVALVWWWLHRQGSGLPSSANYTVAGDDTGAFIGNLTNPVITSSAGGGPASGGCCC